MQNKRVEFGSYRLSKSEIVALLVIFDSGAATARQVEEYTQYSPRFCRTALTRLSREGLLDREREAGDGDRGSRFRYFLSSPAVDWLNCHKWDILSFFDREKMVSDLAGRVCEDEW